MSGKCQRMRDSSLSSLMVKTNASGGRMWGHEDSYIENAETCVYSKTELIEG